MPEFFKAILQNTYEVSNLGRIRSLKTGSFLTPVLTPSGYHQICVSVFGKTQTHRLHKLVSIAFLGEKPEGYQVNHIDGNKTNNRVDNLEYVTPSENTRLAYKMGLANKKGERHHHAKLTEEAVREIRKFIQQGLTNRAIAQRFNVHFNTVSHVKSGRTWSHVS